MNLKNLNGWQRLGILLSAIWLAVVVGGTVVLIFEETDRLKVHQGSGRALVHSEWASASIEAAWPAWAESMENTLKRLKLDQVVVGPYSEAGAREIRYSLP